MVGKMALRPLGGCQPVRERVADIFEPYHLIAGTDYTFDGHLGDPWNGNAEFLPVRAEVDLC